MVVEGTNLTCSRVAATSASEPRSSFKIVGGLARVNPVPLASHPAPLNPLRTCRPSRPVAPVMRAILAMVLIVVMERVVILDAQDQQMLQSATHGFMT